MIRILLGILYLFVLSIPAVASVQTDSIDMAVPFKFPLLLSGNFGELRSNHFHAGLDFKTQGCVGKPIYSPADGYISRATVSPGGYGRAIYVVHDNGYMTVYGHLERFLSHIADTIRKKQYADEIFSVDLRFSPDKYRVRKGELLAYAGNSGYSFGPHLHFEVRTADGEELLNPMRFYKKSLKDNKPPKAYSVMVSPRSGAGVVNGKGTPFIGNFIGNMLCDTVTAWGNIGFSIKADDFMNDTHNRYGVYNIELYIDDSLRFASRMDNYMLADTRLINAWAEYKHYYNTGEWYLRSYMLENNTLPLISADRNNGWLDVNEERIYNVEYRLTDYHGNKSVYTFIVNGMKSVLPVTPKVGDYYFLWYMNNEIRQQGMRLSVPKGELFENTVLNVVETKSQGGVSNQYDLGCFPLKNKAVLSIKLEDTLNLPAEKYYMRRITRKGAVSAGGNFVDGWISADIKILGCYDVAVDTVAPTVKPVNEKHWRNSNNVVFSISDKGCGINDFKGFIDDKFVLFEYSSMRKRLTCNLKQEKVKRGKHILRLVVTDNAGNVTTVEKSIIY